MKRRTKYRKTRTKYEMAMKTIRRARDRLVSMMGYTDGTELTLIMKLVPIGDYYSSYKKYKEAHLNKRGFEKRVFRILAKTMREREDNE